jgi:hypothetical protein
VGRCVSPTGALLSRERGGAGWKTVANGGTVAEGGLLLALPGVQADIESSKGGARLSLRGNLPQLSPTPALEAGVTLRQSADYDLDIVLDRGRIAVSAAKGKASANVRVRARNEIWELSLKDGAEVSLEMIARWSPGMPYKAEYKKGEEPRAEMILLVLKGEADLKVGSQRFSMRAPPGPAFFTWDSLNGPAGTPSSPPALPPWATPEAGRTPEVQAVRAVVKELVAALAQKPASAALSDLLAQADQKPDAKESVLRRQLAITGFGAIDDLGHLLDTLSNEKHPDERAIAVEALRQWIGRKAGQDAILSRYLVRERSYSPAHATILLQLLHSYGQREIEDPVTYELLIAYLQHDKLPIRELAAWQLYRLVPAAAKKIPYNPAGTPNEREAAVKAWKALVPPGELPKQPKG